MLAKVFLLMCVLYCTTAAAAEKQPPSPSNIVDSFGPHNPFPMAKAYNDLLSEQSRGKCKLVVNCTMKIGNFLKNDNGLGPPGGQIERTATATQLAKAAYICIIAASSLFLSAGILGLAATLES